MNAVIKALTSRRSIKKYSSEQIPDSILNDILEAGKNAPTGKNRQSPIMVVVQNKEDIDTLERINAGLLGAEGSHPFYNAPTVVVVMADSSIPTYVEDGSLVMGNLLNAAFSLGIGGCWVHRARQTFETPEGKALIKKWGVPSGYEGIGNCLLGYADCEMPEPKPKKADYIIRV